MKLVFLGTGGGFPSKDRNVTSIGIKFDGEVLLFDCGEGTQRQLMLSSLSYMKIRRIFITHFHGDHFLGIAGLIQSMCLNNRTKPLEIYGPKDTIHFIGNFLKLGFFNQTIPVSMHELSNGEKLDFGNYSIRVLEVDHDVPAVAYSLEEPKRPGRFFPDKAMELGVKKGPDFRKLQSGKTVKAEGKDVTPGMVMGPARKGRKIVYSGDTRPSDELVEFAKDADVLIHDSTFYSDLCEKSEKFGHSTAKQAGEIAKKASVRKLFLTHISNRYSTDDQALLTDAKNEFTMTEIAKDFLEYRVRLRK